MHIQNEDRLLKQSLGKKTIGRKRIWMCEEKMKKPTIPGGFRNKEI
jgi:hypothetical protein